MWEQGNVKLCKIRSLELREPYHCGFGVSRNFLQGHMVFGICENVA